MKRIAASTHNTRKASPATRTAVVSRQLVGPQFASRGLWVWSVAPCLSVRATGSSSQNLASPCRARDCRSRNSRSFAQRWRGRPVPSWQRLMERTKGLKISVHQCSLRPASASTSTTRPRIVRPLLPLLLAPQMTSARGRKARSSWSAKRSRRKNSSYCARSDVAEDADYLGGDADQYGIECPSGISSSRRNDQGMVPG